MKEIIENSDTELLLSVLGLIIIIILGVFFLGTEVPVNTSPQAETELNDQNVTNNKSQPKTAKFTINVSPNPKVNNTTENTELNN